MFAHSSLFPRTCSAPLFAALVSLSSMASSAAASSSVSFGPVPATAVFVHGFKFWRQEDMVPRARLHPITHDYTFGALPSSFQKSYALEYSTSTPFQQTADAAWKAIQDAGLSPSSLVFHGHSCGGLLVSAILEKAAREKAEGPPIAVFTYDSPFGGLHPLVSKVIKETSGASAGGGNAGPGSGGSGAASAIASSLKLFTDPVGFAIQKLGGRFGLLERAKMTPGQIKFLEPILSGHEYPQLKALRQTLMDTRVSNGGHVWAATWQHPKDLKTLEAAQEELEKEGGDESAGAAAGAGSSRPKPTAGRKPSRKSLTGGYLSPDVESIFLSLLPPYMFGDVKEAAWREMEWPWPFASETSGTALCHLSGHGQGQMFTDERVVEVKQRAMHAVNFRRQQEEAVRAFSSSRSDSSSHGRQPGHNPLSATAAATSKEAAGKQEPRAAAMAIGSSGEVASSAADGDVAERR